MGLAGGLNLYGFAGGDPVNSSDPFGLCQKNKDGSEDANCRKLVNDLTATANKADKQLPKGETNHFREAAAAYEATDRKVEIVGPLDKDLNYRHENDDGNPDTFAMGRTMDDRILIGNFLGKGDVMAVATHEILVHGPEKGVYVGDLIPATMQLNREIWSQLPAALRPSAELWRRYTQ
jgi:hypothetical protein